MRMIYSVTFDDTIPYTISKRASRFDIEGGWDIVEEAPGRICLTSTSANEWVIVQSMPYTLSYTPSYAPTTGIISEATLGNTEMKAESVLAAGKKNGRKGA